MKLVSYKCPNCNGYVQVDISKHSFFCTYCGAPISIDFEGNKSFTYIEIDEAKIKEAEVNEKIEINKMDYELKKMELQNQKNKDELKWCAIIYIIIMVMATIIILGVVLAIK